MDTDNTEDDLTSAAINRRYQEHQWDAEPLTDTHDPQAWAATRVRELYRPYDHDI